MFLHLQMYDIDEIDDLAEEAIQNFPQLSRESLSRIDPRIHSYYNSINVFCGKQGQGKTYSAVKEIAKITNVNDRTCLVVYVSRDGIVCDDTFEALKHLISVPIRYVSEQDAEGCIRELEEAMNAYKDIKDFNYEEQIKPSVRAKLFSLLSIEDFSRPHLHIIVLFDDFANSALIKKPESFFSKFLATLRHRGFSAFICIQFWKSIPTQLKSNVTLIYLFAGYSRQQLRFILDQVPLSHDWRLVYEKYCTLLSNEKMIVDSIDGKVYFDTK
jgi:hypothetical protein